MSYYTKYKDIVYIHCFGPNDEYSALNKGRYSSNGLKMNSKIFRFNLGTDFYNLKLSKKAKFQLLFLTVPGYYDTTTYSDFNIIRLRTATECKIWDSYKKSFGYPIIYKQSTAHVPENYVPNMESFISINSNFFNSGYIEFELEHPNEGSQDIEFTNSRNNAFYIHFKIIDVEDEETNDRTLAPLMINDETVNYSHNKGNFISKLRDRPVK
jgi:hypothetical protein